MQCGRVGSRLLLTERVLRRKSWNSFFLLVIFYFFRYYLLRLTRYTRGIKHITPLHKGRGKPRERGAGEGLPLEDVARRRPSYFKMPSFLFILGVVITKQETIVGRWPPRPVLPYPALMNRYPHIFIVYF